MSETKRIVVLAGDGIGPEIVGATRQVLDAVGDFEYTEHLIGGASIDEHGVALTDEVIAACKDSDAVLLGAVGGPKWDEAVANDPTAPRPEQGLLGIRKALGLYANLRPVKPSPALIDASPLKKELIDGTDLLVVRELTGGIYFGASGRREENGGTAYDECAYSVPEIQRITRAAFEAARQRSDSPRVLSVDKANVLETSRLWRETVKEVAEEYPDVQLDHLLVDFAAMKLVSAPAEIDVIVTENLFGDILSDEAAMLTGSLGMLPSASLGAPDPVTGKRKALYEPVHGSAPDIAGKGVANPIAMLASFAMALRYSFNLVALADRLEAAISSVLADGLRTGDIAQDNRKTVGTEEMGAAILKKLAA